MKEATGNIWDHFGAAIIAITTNGDVRSDGAAVMGAGFALEAKRHFPGLALKLGRLIREHGNNVYDLDHGLVSFPTKRHWWEKSDLSLIRRSCYQLVELADRHGWTAIVLPRPGCGRGGLLWEEVFPAIPGILDDRFTLMKKGADHFDRRNAGSAATRFAKSAQ